MKKSFIVDVDLADTDFQSVADEMFEKLQDSGFTVMSVKPFAPKGANKPQVPFTAVAPASPGGRVE